MTKRAHIAKFLILLTTILLLAGNRYAHAQNTFDDPYINSWHQYSVTMGDVENTPTWRLEKRDETTQYIDIDGDENWVEITGGATKYIAIEFEDTRFNIGQTWYLVYSEMSKETGECVALREFEINITDNSFYLTLGDNIDNWCNSNSGRVLNWDDILNDGTNKSGLNTPIEQWVEFTVKMNKAANFTINSWEFNGVVDIATGSFDRITAPDGNPNGLSTQNAAYTITDNADNTLSVEVNNPDNDTDVDDEITIRVWFTGLVHDSDNVTLDVSDGVAKSGTDYVVETDDNLNKPPPPDNLRTQEIIVLPLPATSNIAIVD